MKTLLTSSLLLAAASAFAQSAVPVDTVPDTTVDLDDFVIIADKPVVQTDGAKLTYNMEEDPSSKGNTLMEALKKVPMISVDGEDNIRLNGQSSFKIYVNGKEDPSLTTNYKNVFKAMPSEAVAKVEVITEPGAKYDAEGTAGIINIIAITKNTTDGYSGTVSASFSKQQASGSLYGRIRKGNLALSANVDYADNSAFSQKNKGELIMENIANQEAPTVINRQQQNVSFRYAGGGVHLSYDLTPNDLLTADATVYAVKGWLNEGSFMSTSNIKNGSLISFLKRRTNGHLANTGVNAGAAWQHQFNEAGQKLIVSYLYNYGYNKLDISFTKEEDFGGIPYSPFERNSMTDKQHEHTAQVDYINPFGGDRHTLEAGAKTVWRRNNALSTQYFGDSNMSYVENPDNYSDLTQKQDIYAVYVSYSGQFGNFKTTAGVRYEHTQMGIDYHSGSYSDFLKRLNDVVPNAALTYNFTPSSNLRLAYQMRIRRPSLNSVNPFVMNYSPNEVSQGNPDLTSERANKISLKYSNFGSVLGGNIGVEYSVKSNAITSYTYMDGDVLYHTYANIGKEQYFAVSGYLSWSIIPGMQFSVNGRLQKDWYESKSLDCSNSGWSLNYGANLNYKLPAEIKLNLYGGQKTRSYELQGYNNGWYYYGLGLSRDFLKNKSLTVTLSANDFLQSESHYRSVSIADSVRSSNKWTNYNWNVGLSVSWNFGSLKSDVKRTSTRITNDDKAETGGKKGASF
ncbi:MAG: outer membrane beta-barrel family protein [Muribaculaceae bacterium]|nr:outer membrane beta-barrel family protein [Muribaculaceae bacterium]